MRRQFFKILFHLLIQPGKSTNIIIQKVGVGHFHSTHQNFLLIFVILEILIEKSKKYDGSWSGETVGKGGVAFFPIGFRR